MKPRNFALIVGAATFAAFVLCMCLESCGSSDWFDAYYSECVDMCSAAKEWSEECALPAMRQDCVGWLWYLGTDLARCESAATCYRALQEAGDCLESWGLEDGWNPPTFAGGCPVQVP